MRDVGRAGVDQIKTQLGFWVVIAGFVGTLVALWIVLGRFSAANDVTAVLAPITTTIAGLGGAFFGISLGQQGKEKAEDERNKAQKRAELYASMLAPDQARMVIDAQL
jgi:hypothetical protein